tara:strand:- start:15512 stop:16588 length:1077 start_codon:yes stop_codon:yes gene_type:complete
MKNRLIGVDVARTFAIVGMIIINFKVVFGENGNKVFKLFASFLEGKAAATFVVLAGVGVAFMSNSAAISNNKTKIKRSQIIIAKRAIFLFIVGILYSFIWIADILHFYGVYMLVTLFLISYSKRFIFNVGMITVLSYPFLMLVFNYETSWDFETLTYFDFWTISGFLRNLLYNGFHPLIPWIAFMFLGLWFGKQDLTNDKFIKKSVLVSASIYITMLLISKLLIYIISKNNKLQTLELKYILGTSPMPPLPIYMISSSAVAIFIISSCIFISKKYKNNFLINVLAKTGRLALTFYIAHIVLGMGIIETIYPEKMGHFSIEFSVFYALSFSLICCSFAVIWTKYNNLGPLEWLMRKITS